VTLFGYGSAEGSNRLHEALEAALKSPLLSIAGKGQSLREASMMLLLLSGPSDLSFAEVQRAVSEIERIVGERCQIKVGVHAKGSPGSLLELFITASPGGVRTPAKNSETAPIVTQMTPPPVHQPEENAAKVTAAPLPTKVTKPTKGSPVKQTQGVLDLDTYQRGRFDKSEPTIVAGEDLDIPTFLRKGVKLGPPSRH
jgi:cell division protein FtsZ